ncbi:MAG: alpha/beta hydrolase, partial [SAR324 cluster bacterium]|nr:alpha/beta hydrolase [SAR324 cluster bacterium]
FIHYIDIDWPDLFRPILTTKTNFFNRIRIRREVIPIIFVPGMMGSRLKRGKEIVWDPDREIMCMLLKYGGFWNTPAQRKKMLIGEKFDPGYLQVSEDDTKHNKMFTSEADPGRESRGWGGVYWGAYGGLLEELQDYNWNKPVSSDDKDKKKELAGKCFEFPVHAFGYNWTDSNYNSGKNLANKIEEIIDGYKTKERLCKYVILVTHSMGGLVARSACVLHGAQDNVLGVIHGVQPAVGAAAAYWRMKAGFERTGIASTISAWVLGTNGEEVTCILGNAPGGLELLPTKDYTQNDGGKQWLHITLQDGKEISLPQYDPYSEIYRIGENINIATQKKDASFWRLVNPDWLDPKNSGKIPDSHDPANHFKEPWDEYVKCLDKACALHEGLKTRIHNSTYQFYSSGISTVDKITFKHEEFLFRKQYAFGTGYSEPASRASFRGESTMFADMNHQEIASTLPQPQKTFVACMCKVSDFREGGDGTVPESSGSALRGDGSIIISGMRKYDHQDVYKKREARDFIVTAIRNLALKLIIEKVKEGYVDTAKW